MNTSSENPQGSIDPEQVDPEQTPDAGPEQAATAPFAPVAPPPPPAPTAPHVPVEPAAPVAPVRLDGPPPAPPSPGGWYGYPQPAQGTMPPVAEAPVKASWTRRWMPLVGTAAAAALLASVGTAGLLHLSDTSTTGSSVSISSLGATSSTSGVPVSGSTSDNPDWEAVAAAVRPSVVAIDVQTQSGTAKGSGVVVDTDGHVITNNHVVDGATSDGLSVTLSDGRIYQATVVGTDQTTDLAVLLITDPPKDLSAAVVADSDTVAVGAPVMAVGNPLGLDSTVTTGIVSALDRPVSTSDGSDTTVTNAIQIDAAINPGNSGGPLFDATGEVIGITSSIASLSSGGSSSGSIGLGFAIPSNLVDQIAAELIETGTADHAFLGVTLSDETATVDGTTRLGAAIQSVTAGTPAAEAGLQAGDIVVAIGDDPVNGAESLTAFVREHAAGTNDTLTIVRDGTARTVDVTFAALSEAQAASQGSSDGGSTDQNGGPSLPFSRGQQG